MFYKKGVFQVKPKFSSVFLEEIALQGVRRFSDIQGRFNTLILRLIELVAQGVQFEDGEIKKAA